MTDSNQPAPEPGKELPKKPSNTGKMPSSDAGIIKEAEQNVKQSRGPYADRDDAVADMIRKGDRD